MPRPRLPNASAPFLRSNTPSVSSSGPSWRAGAPLRAAAVPGLQHHAARASCSDSSIMQRRTTPPRITQYRGTQGTCSSLGSSSSSPTPRPRSFACSRRYFATQQAARDPYTTLGLNRAATPAELKTRYRELAKQYHPDLNTHDPSCAEKMARITDAYAVLMDPKKRREIDAQFGAGSAGAAGGGSGAAGAAGAATPGGAASYAGGAHEWVDASQMYSEFNNIFGKMANRMSRGGNAGPQQTRGDDVSVDVELNFMEAMKGTRKRINVRLKQPCGDCGASGAQAGSGWVKCTLCNGTGVRRVERGIMSMGLPCAKCSGVGELLEFPCHSCNGDGIGTRASDVEVEIPRGIKSSMELRLPGHGHAGMRGGKRGHLFVTVRVLPHPVFRHIEDDVHIDVPLSLGELLLGGRKTIPTLDGDTDIQLSSRNLPNSTKILRGRGPARMSRTNGATQNGNMVLHFKLDLPTELSAEQIRLIRDFEKLERDKASQKQEAARPAGEPARAGVRGREAGTAA